MAEQTNRELLELAARAAGFKEFTWDAEPRARNAQGVAGPWNPLKDRAQLFDLADHLRMLLDFGDDEISVTVFDSEQMQTTRVQFRDGRPRHDVIAFAIVRAAARIGATMAPP